MFLCVAISLLANTALFNKSRTLLFIKEGFDLALLTTFPELDP